MSWFRARLLLPLFLSLSWLGGAQNAPYSLFNFGKPEVTVGPSGLAMSGVYQGDRVTPDWQDPSSLARLELTSFSLAARLGGTYSSDTWFGHHQPQYIGLSFPLVSGRMGWLTALYSERDSRYESQINGVDYQAEGGLYRLVSSIGANLFKGVSVGFEGGYRFGKISYTKPQEESVYVRSFFGKAALTVEFPIGEAGRWAFTGVHETRFFLIRETGELRLEKEEYGYAQAWTANSTLHLSRGLLGFRYDFEPARTYQPSWDYPSSGEVTQVARHTYRLGGGVVLTNIKKRPLYLKGGMRFGSYGIEIAGVQVYDFAVSSGIEVPIRGGTVVSVGLELGRIQTWGSESFVDSTYFNVSIALDFVQKWFMKKTYR